MTRRRPLSVLSFQYWAMPRGCAPRKFLRGCVLCAACCLFAGCTSLLNQPAELFTDQPDFETPSQVIPVWTDSVLHQAGRKGSRGCGGRVMFYAADDKQAVRVDGSLVVYVWDDSKPNRERRPDRKYVFRADDLQQHYSRSKIGHSYSFWIPWDDAGGPRSELTVVARFVGRNGAEVTSSPANVILPGAILLPTSVPRDGDTPPGAGQATAIQQASFADSSSEPVRSENTGMKTSEINLPPGFLQRNSPEIAAAAFTADDLFSHRDEPVDATTRVQAEPRPVTAPGPVAANPGAAIPGGAPVEGHSLRFRDRVRTSRAARRSVDRALSERYQSAPRSAPWDSE